MYRFFFLVAITMLTSTMARTASANTKISTKLTLQQLLLEEVKKTKELITKQSKLDDKLNAIQDLKLRVEKHYKQRDIQTPEVDIWLDVFKGSLDLIPEKKKFSLQKCDEYSQQVRLQYDPQADYKNGYEPVKSTLELIKLLCGR